MEIAGEKRKKRGLPRASRLAISIFVRNFGAISTLFLESLSFD
jgi:hypothetical protein